MKDITVVTPVFNQLHLTKKCLESLINGSVGSHELIVVDNNSTDGTGAFLKEFSAVAEEKGWKFHVVSNMENMGVGFAFNQGIRMSSSEFVALLNNDTWIMPGWDTVLLRRINELGAAMIGPYYDEAPFDEATIVEKAERFVARNSEKKSGDWCSIMMFFRRSTFEKVGLFDERYFVSYEDTDIKERMMNAGLAYYTVGDCFVWHHAKGTRDTIPPRHEVESLGKFVEKWGFDPRLREQARLAKFRRSWKKIKNRYGFF